MELQEIMRNKNIIVTGGAGFIGSNLARYFSNDNNHVVVIDNLTTGRLENIQDLIEKEKIQFVKASITDLQVLIEEFKGFDYVFHEAALPSVSYSIREPLLTNDVNINGTLNILVAAKNTGIKKVIYASSSSVYGDSPTLLKTETMLLNPLSPYAVSKLTGEYYCSVFTNVFHLPTVALRYFNVYGPRQNPHGEYAAVIPRFIMNILNNKSPIVYGDGNQTRDFTFINDVVRANVLAAESDATGVFNASGGKCITINELAIAIMNLCKKNLKIQYCEARPGDIKHSLSDSSKAKEKFGFTCLYDIKDGLKETIEWFQK